MNSSSQSGFTLIETLLYAVFLSFMLGGTLGAAFQIIQNSDRMSAQIAAQEDATFIIRKLDWALTSATDVAVPTPTTLIVSRASAPTLTTFDLSGSDLRMARGAASPAALNGTANPIASLSFTRFASPKGIRATFSINGQPFTMTYYLHK